MYFETRLESLYSANQTPALEMDAAINIHDRLVTAQSICKSVFGSSASPEIIAAVLSEISSEANRIRTEDDRLRNEESSE